MSKGIFPIRPLDDHVVVKMDNPMDVTPGGIIIPEKSVNQMAVVATVMAVGPGRVDFNGKRDPIKLDPGDRVYTGRALEKKIVLKGEEYFFCRSSNIQGVLYE